MDEPVKMRHPESTLNHVDELDRHLGGFLVVGDALCSFNPIYGQGRTVAVMEAELLRSLLAEHGRQDLAPWFFAAAATLPAEPWSLATGGDLRLPEVEGERGPQDEEVNGYLDQFRASAAIDPALGTAFLKVAIMMAPVTSLLSPELMERTQRPRAQERPGTRPRRPDPDRYHLRPAPTAGVQTGVRGCCRPLQCGAPIGRVVGQYGRPTRTAPRASGARTGRRVGRPASRTAPRLPARTSTGTTDRAPWDVRLGLRRRVARGASGRATVARGRGPRAGRAVDPPCRHRPHIPMTAS
ncbi:hypothetical protein [Streptomyces olivaceoviridis]|uniref:hypothetical protein n=1 Tax=Streptomyces olivaceoviridis TaxID=1921 RepID=UPI0036F4C41C